MVTKIQNNLYLGDWNDAQKFEGSIICVMQELLSIEPMNAYWIPIIRTSKPTNDHQLIEEQELTVTALPQQLHMVATRIISNQCDGIPTLVHCMAGIERSPLAIVWYLHAFKYMGWNKAYDFVKKKRPEVANRLSWLNLSYDDLMG